MWRHEQGSRCDLIKWSCVHGVISLRFFGSPWCNRYGWLGVKIQCLCNYPLNSLASRKQHGWILHKKVRFEAKQYFCWINVDGTSTQSWQMQITVCTFRAFSDALSLGSPLRLWSVWRLAQQQILRQRWYITAAGSVAAAIWSVDVKPVLNSANICFAGHSSEYSSNFTSFVNGAHSSPNFVLNRLIMRCKLRPETCGRCATDNVIQNVG